MKKSIFLFGLVTVANFLNAQVYSTSTGSVNFISKTKFEEFQATNKQVSAAISTEKGAIQFKVPVNSFQFEKDLMQQHFQENYMESATFPNSTFKGKLNPEKKVNFAVDGTYKVLVDGALELHGVSKDISVPGTITVKGGKITLAADFTILCSDYGVKIPKNNMNQVSNSIDISVNCELSPKKK